MSLRLAAVLLWLIVGLASGPAVRAQSPDQRFFPETGHSASGDFLQFFETHGDVDILGPPVSGELMEDGVRVQYFRNVRLELHPENADSYRVQPGLLGDLAGESQPPISSSGIPPAGATAQRYYPQTGHTVGYGFLLFFDQHGGIDLFGYPIGEMTFAAGGRVVQWFQKAQLEWRPDERGGTIQLSPLGEEVFTDKYLAPPVPVGSEDHAAEPENRLSRPPAAPQVLLSTGEAGYGPPRSRRSPAPKHVTAAGPRRIGPATGGTPWRGWQRPITPSR